MDLVYLVLPTRNDVDLVYIGLLTRNVVDLVIAWLAYKERSGPSNSLACFQGTKWT